LRRLYTPDVAGSTPVPPTEKTGVKSLTPPR
jgi:hypothetical protein